jgi:hypothetical protein
MNMKKFMKFMKQIAFTGSILCIALLSCTDMNELSDRFLDQGETVYASKADSIATHTGYKKIEIEIYINNRRVDKVRIYWNNYRDSVDVQVGNRQGVFRTIIEDMEESTYLFQIVSIDSYGNKSLPVEASGEVIGDSFVANLRNRSVASVVYTADDEVTVTWGNTPNYAVSCYLSYTATDNRTVIVIAPVTESVTVISGWKSGLSYYTQFVPNEGALDTVNSTTASLAVWKKYNKTGWTIEVSDETASDGGGKDKMIDGNYDYNEYWQSQHSPSTVNLPHWAVIDMKDPVEIARIVTQRRNIGGNIGGDTRTLQYFVGDSPNPDAGTWVKLVEGSYESSTANHVLTLDVPTPLTGRYLKLVMPNTFRGQYTSICEIDVYGLIL